MKNLNERWRQHIFRQSLNNEFALNINGLGSKGESLADEAGLMDQRFHQDNRAISLACRKVRKRELETGRKELGGQRVI